MVLRKGGSAREREMAEAGATAGAGGGVGAAVVKEGKLFKRGGNQIQFNLKYVHKCMRSSN